MNCQDVAKLRTPLDAVCQTTDIGCVPIVDGKPTCTVQPDELPIAFDPKTTTLWLFSCKTREWIPFQKFTVCQLNALNLENITNICDVLNIAVNYAGSGECQQGTVSLRELAERILECLTLETKIITIGQGDGNKVKISIEGLPLDPVYVTGRNIWSEGGSGTETDPLKVATYDPICKWPVKNQSEVDAADTKHLGACLDGEMSRVPFPPKICELPPRNQAQVDSAQSVELAACVDGEEVKIPYIKPSPPVCEAPNLTLAESQAMQNTLKLVACKADGDFSQTVKIPINGSGFFSYNTDWKYLCVPLSDGYPTGAPSEGSGPFRMDCNGNLYVWLCDQNRWQITRDGIEGIPFLNPDNIPDICDNLRMKGWFSNNADPCVQDVQMTLAQLADLIMNYCTGDSTYCNDPVKSFEGVCFPHFNNRSFDLTGITLADRTNAGVSTYGNYIAVYNVREHKWEQGRNPVFIEKHQNPDYSHNALTHTITNDFDCTAYYDIVNSCQIVQTSRSSWPADFSVSLISAATTDPTCSWTKFMGNVYNDNDDPLAPTRRYATANWSSVNNFNHGEWGGDKSNPENRFFTHRVLGNAAVSVKGKLAPGESVNYYIHTFLVITSTSSSITADYPIVRAFGSYIDVRMQRGYRF